MNVRAANEITSHLVQTLKKHLGNDERVVWLVPGGSGIDTAIKITSQLTQAGLDLSNLSITLTDERFGPVGHSDENWQQFINRGLSVNGAETYRVLQPDLDLEDTAEAFGDTLEEWLSEADYSIGMFGIGADGHIAGIKPESPAATSKNWAAGYEWDDFTRITATPKAIKALDEVVAYAVGESKTEALRTLIEEDLSVNIQPAQILKQALSSTLFTDYKDI